MIGRLAFILFVNMFLGILPSSVAREGRLDWHGASSREACKVFGKDSSVPEIVKRQQWDFGSTTGKFGQKDIGAVSKKDEKPK